MSDEPPIITPSAASTPSASKLPLVGGFLTGALPWLLSLAPMKNQGALPFLIFACFGLPIIAAILAIIPRTRRFGLGLLLACGLGWLVLGAICGGAFR